MPSPPPILFIAPWLPKLSETFVYLELFGLRDSGVAVLGASVHAPEQVWDESRLQTLTREVVPVYGSGPLRLLLDAALETLGHPVSALRTGMTALGDVLTFLGSWPNSEVRKNLLQAAIFVLPCSTDASGDKDGIPVFLMAAMACGVCAVSDDLPTIRELINHRENGLACPPGRRSGPGQLSGRAAGRPEPAQDHRGSWTIAHPGGIRPGCECRAVAQRLGIDGEGGA